MSTSLRRSSFASTITGSSPNFSWKSWVALYSLELLLTSVSVPAFVSSCVAAKIPAPVRATIGAISSQGQRTATVADPLEESPRVHEAQVRERI